MKNKKNKSETAADMTEIITNSQRELKPPAHVRLHEADLPFFDSVISEFARSEWTDHQLELAALLARSIAGMEREQFLLHREGSIMKTDKGTPVVNPRKSIVQMYAGTILSMRRSLSLQAKSRAIEPRRMAASTAKAKKTEAAVDNLGMDDLIPMPNSKMLN